MTIIVPAILATTEEEYVQKLQLIESNSELKLGWVQIDLMDSKFVQNTSIKPDVIGRHLTPLKIEAQLMVEYPNNWIDELVKINVKRIVFPIEDFSGTAQRIEQIKSLGLEVGLSINPETAVETLGEFMSMIDVVLIMSVHPGFGGQQFIPESIEKIKQAKSWGANVKIGVDGGISFENARDLAVAGADYLVVGSHLLEGDIDENLGKFKESFKI